MAFQKTALIRVFIDSSILFAAASSATGFARDLILASLAPKARFRLYLSPYVVEEVRRTIAKKRPQALPVFAKFIRLLPHRVTPARDLVLKTHQIVVLEDAPILAGAISADAIYLLTYDRKHLLHHAPRILEDFGIIVTTPEQFLTNPARNHH